MLLDRTDPRRAWRDREEHVAEYLATGGVVGHTWARRPHLLLTTTGRRTGVPRTVPLVYARPAGPAAGALAVVASAGGAEAHPQWYRNLVADPEVVVQLWGRRWRAVAATASGPARAAAWQAAVAVWDGFERYRRATAREIPVVLLRPHRPPT